MSKKQQKKNSKWLMILTIAATFLVVLIVIGAFFMLHRQEEVKIAASLDTEYTDADSFSEQDTDSESDLMVGDSYSGGRQSEAEAETEIESSLQDSDDKIVYGNEKSSNRYERADHLRYTSSEYYTEDDLAGLDSYGLKITRNEIYARHGRIFNDQELQEYFERQDWYVPLIAANDFDESCLNEVEMYNLQLIMAYEQRLESK